MVASTVSLILMLALLSIILEAIQTAEGMHTRVMMNQEAREIFDVLAFGGPKTGVNNTPTASVDHNYSFGLRGRRDGTLSGGWAEPQAQGSGQPGSPGALMAWNADHTARLYRFALPAGDAWADGLPSTGFYSQPINALEMACTSVSQPVQDCAGSTGSVTVAGKLRADPGVGARSYTNLTSLREVVLQIFDPFSTKNTRASFSEVSGVYWTSFTMNVD